MATIVFTFEDKTIHQPIQIENVTVDQSILDIAEDNDIHLNHNCGGVCACSTCIIMMTVIIIIIIIMCDRHHHGRHRVRQRAQQEVHHHLHHHRDGQHGQHRVGLDPQQY